MRSEALVNSPYQKEYVMSSIKLVSEVQPANLANAKKLHDSPFATLTSPKTQELRARYEAQHAEKTSAPDGLKKV